MNEQITLNNFVGKFYEKFPQFLDHPVFGDPELYKDASYALIGTAAMYLSASDEGHRLTEKESEEIINWVNELWNDPSVAEEIKDMFWIEFFENISTDKYKNYLMQKLTDRANLNLRQYLYIVEHGGLTDPKSGEILKYMGDGVPAVRTGKYVSDIK